MLLGGKTAETAWLYKKFLLDDTGLFSIELRHNEDIEALYNSK